MDLGLLANTSRKEVLLIILRSPVITWPAGLYMNGELAQVQSGGLNLKSSILSLKYKKKFHYFMSNENKNQGWQLISTKSLIYNKYSYSKHQVNVKRVDWLPAEARYWPFGEKAKANTVPLCPCISRTLLPSCKLHSRTVLSLDAVAM